MASTGWVIGSNSYADDSVLTSVVDSLNGFTLTRTSVAAGSTKSITLAENSSYLIITTGASATTEHTLSTALQTTASATPITRTMVSGSAVTVAAPSAKTLTVANTSSTHLVYIAILTLRGSAPTV